MLSLDAFTIKSQPIEEIEIQVYYVPYITLNPNIEEISKMYINLNKNGELENLQYKNPEDEQQIYTKFSWLHDYGNVSFYYLNGYDANRPYDKLALLKDGDIVYSKGLVTLPELETIAIGGTFNISQSDYRIEFEISSSKTQYSLNSIFFPEFDFTYPQYYNLIQQNNNELYFDVDVAIYSLGLVMQTEDAFFSLSLTHYNPTPSDIGQQLLAERERFFSSLSQFQSYTFPSIAYKNIIDDEKKWSYVLGAGYLSGTDFGMGGSLTYQPIEGLDIGASYQIGQSFTDLTL